MTTDHTEFDVSHTLAGGGELNATIRGRERMVSGLEYDLRKVVKARNARYFGEQPRGPGRPLVTVDHKYSPIVEAVDAVREVPSFEKNTEGDVSYVIEEAYYPGEYSHYIDVSGIEPERRGMAFMHVQSKLAARELTVNSVRCDDEGRLEKLHVVRLAWIDEKRKESESDE